MYYYRAFNLLFSSEIELPLSPSPPGASDIAIRIMPSDVHAGPPIHMAWSYHVTPRLATLAYAEFGTLSVIEGRAIHVCLRPHADETLIPSYLTGAAMAVLLYQRGLIVLKASAVAIAGKAVVLLSDRGGGKSALAAVLCRRGHSLLTDGITAIDLRHGQPIVLTAYPQIELDLVTATAIGVERASLHLIHPREPKLALRLSDARCAASAPLYLIVLLQTGMDNNVNYLPLQASLASIIHNSYPHCLLQPEGIEYLRQCSRLIGAVPVCQLTRRYDLAELSEHAQMIEDTVLTRHLASGNRRSKEP